ncbi:MAG: MEDS domain-containing protein, partial [Gemmatimonadaceae bacterium]|nr:MEDS domain-containing protein [Gemmatimonadaceae bacterium]
MKECLRKSGIDIIGDVPWGTHFCQFYRTQGDLLDILVPYFKAGLDNNEFCMWVTSHPLTEREAEDALRIAVPDFDRYRELGQIEIVPHTDWYLKGGFFDSRQVLSGWVEKHDNSLKRGHSGLRLTGNTFWLEKAGWEEFLRYEDDVNNVIGKYRMMAVCTYSLDRCGASEIIDVVNTHQFALARRDGKWNLIESSGQKRAEEALRESERRERERAEELATLLEAVPTPVIIVHDPGATHMTGNRAADELLQHPRGSEVSLSAPPEVKPRHFRAMKDGRELRLDELPAQRAARGESVQDFEFNLVFDDGMTRHLLGYGTPLLDGRGLPRGAVHVLVDISVRKRAEEALRASAAEKEILLKELAHRTKNNMQVIGSLLTLQAAASGDQ